MLGRSKQIYEFGPFRLIPQERQLLREGQAVALSPKAFDLLLVLVEHNGHLVEKDELLKRVWPDSFVEEANLSVKMTALRRALGERPKERTFIETVAKRGYRFVASVREVWDNGIDTLVQQQAGSSITEEDAAVQHDWRVSASSREFPTASVSLWLTGQREKVSGIFTSRLALALYFLTALMIVAALVYPLIFRRAPAVSKPDIKSLAVLPLENLSGDPSQEYVADGMTEALITELSRISALRVISRTSVMQYKAARKPVPEIARELNVDAVVEGSVIRSGERVQITVHLIRAATEQHLWAEGYERDLRDVISLQREVARTIANEISVKLTPQEQMLLTSARPVNPDAYDAFLMGVRFQNQYMNEQREEPLRKALDHFERAITLDSSFALAYAWVTFSYGELSNFGYPEFISKSKAAAMKGVQIDPSLAEAHGSLAYVLLHEWDWSGAEREFKRTIELNPNYSWGHWGYAVYLTDMGQYEEAIAENKLAEKLDPLLILPKHNIGSIYMCARQYDRSIEQLRAIIDIEPNNAGFHNDLGLAYAYKGMYNEALAELQKATQLSGGSLRFRSSFAYVYAMWGKRSEALKILDEFKDPSKQTFFGHVDRASIYSLLGEKEQAFELLEKAYEEHDRDLPWIKFDPGFDSLRSDPRFQELLRRVGLPR